MPFEWKVNVVQEIEGIAAKGLLRVALFVQAEHQKRLGVSSPHKSGGKGKPLVYTNPARRGEYPKYRTGAGQSSVAIAPTTVAGITANGLKVAVGVRQIINPPWLNYLEVLAAKGWLGLVDTYNAVKGDLQRVAKG